MKKTISILAVVAILVVGMFILTGCEKNNSQQTNNNVQNDVNFKNNNDSYYFVIDGKKYKAGDKITSLEQSGLVTRSVENGQTVPANKYMIGAGYMVNENKKTVLQVTPYNTENTAIEIKNTAIGGVVIDSANLKNDERIANIEVYGGIKIGSTEEQLKQVYGEPSSTYEGTSYDSFTYKSDKVYRSFEFRVSKEDRKVTYMKWQNFTFKD